MRLSFHPSVASDIARVMAHYQQVAGAMLADEFYAELRSSFTKALEAPHNYAIHSGDLRRVNLKRFPYHFLSESPATMSECSWCDTTAGALPSAQLGDRAVPIQHPIKRAAM